MKDADLTEKDNRDATTFTLGDLGAQFSKHGFNRTSWHVCAQQAVATHASPSSPACWSCHMRA